MNFTYRPTPISAKTAIMAILFGILVGAVLILATGNDPLEIYAALIRGACGSTFSLASSIRWTIPLIFAGTAASIAFKGGVFNMGVEGQMYMGGLAAAIIGVTCTDLPAPVLIPLMLVSSMLVGMIWALPPILAKVFFGSSEVVPCMMLNYVAMYLTDYLVHNVFSGQRQPRRHHQNRHDRRTGPSGYPDSRNQRFYRANHRAGGGRPVLGADPQNQTGL